MDARLESRYLSSNYTTRNLFEDLIKLKTCLMILIFSSYVKSSDPQVSRCARIVAFSKNIKNPFASVLMAMFVL